MKKSIPSNYQKKLKENNKTIEKNIFDEYLDEFLQAYQVDQKKKIKDSFQRYNEDSKIFLNQLNKNYLQLNVGGQVFTTTLDTLTKIEGNYLHDIFTGKMNIILDRNNMVFIDRDGEYFGYVLDYLRDEEVIMPDDLLIVEMIMKEFEFYRIEIKPKTQKFKFGQLRSSFSLFNAVNLSLTNRTGALEFGIGDQEIQLPLDSKSFQWSLGLKGDWEGPPKLAFGLIQFGKKRLEEFKLVVQLSKIINEGKPQTHLDIMQLLQDKKKLQTLYETLITRWKSTELKKRKAKKG